jgi:hypothetical protein
MKAIFVALAILLFTQPVAADNRNLDFCEVYTAHVKHFQLRWAAAITNLNREYKKKERNPRTIATYTKSAERDFEQLKHFIPVYTAYCK